MTGFIPVPPDPWVPTATDSETKLFPAATMDALDEHNDGRYATTEQGEKADSAYQLPEAGVPVSDLEEAVQTSLGKADEAVPNTEAGRTALAASPELGAAIAEVVDEAVVELPETFVPTARTPSAFRLWGRKGCFGGDSITNGAGATGSQFTWRARTLARLGARMSGDTVNGGVNGDTSAMLLARMDALIAQGIQWMLVDIGMNDTDDANWVSVANYAANIQAIKAKLDAAGLPMGLGAITPVGSAATNAETRIARINSLNIFLKMYAAEQGIPFVDTYAALIDPATGYLNATYWTAGDPIHPNNAGHDAISVVKSTFLAQYLPTFTWPVVGGVNGAGGMSIDPLALGAAPYSWEILSGTSGSSSIVTDGDGKRWVRITLDNSAGGSAVTGIRRIALGSLGAKWTTGDLLAAFLEVRSSSVTALNKIQWMDSTSTALSVSLDGAATVGPLKYLFRYTVPSRTWTGTLGLAIIFRAGAGEVATVDIAAGADVYNITQMGLAGLTSIG